MIRINKSRIMYVFGLTALFIAAVPIVAMAADSKPAMYATIWAVLPPIVAIGLALITKEVYSSLFIGILAGGLIYSGMNFPKFMNHVMIDGFVSSLSSAGNVGILVFLVILGMLVAMMNLSGGSAAFGNWAAQRIKTRRGAQYSTVTLGILIFVDDYFNCLTVGSVMKPLTDKYNISRAKLAYLILGCSCKRFCRRKKWSKHIYSGYSLQLLRTSHHRHDVHDYNYELRLWKNGSL